jgi:ARG/rhodanese/phosphatase superfamily protein
MTISISRRTLLHIVGLTALASPLTTWADRQRILADGPDAPFTGGPGGPGAPGHLPDWKRAMSALRVGSASRHGALTVFWLSANTPATPLEIATLDEARASGALVIAERERAAVPELSVDNRGKTHVLLLAGEILVGGKQNRVLREDILLPPLSGPRSLGVYCVEQGRWNEGKRDFESKSTFAHPALRREVYDKAEQGRVWREVARSASAAAAPSPTGSYQQVYEQPQVREHLDEAERGLDAGVSSGALGAAVFVGASLSGVDVFRDAGLFAREWRKLLRAHAVEAYARSSVAPAPEAKQRADLQRVLTAATMAAGLIHTNAGVGQVFEFKLQEHRGAALGYEGAIVHAAIL